MNEELKWTPALPEGDFLVMRYRFGNGPWVDVTPDKQHHKAGTVFRCTPKPSECATFSEVVYEIPYIVR